MSRIKEKPQSGEYGNKRNDKGGTNRTAEVCAKTKVPGTYIRDPLGHAGKRKTAALQKHAELKELLKPYTIENLTCRKRKKKKSEKLPEMQSEFLPAFQPLPCQHVELPFVIREHRSHRPEQSDSLAPSVGSAGQEGAQHLSCAQHPSALFTWQPYL